jgi:hypothetical protein
MTQDIEPSTVAYFNVLMLLELGVTVVVCTDSSADTVANRSRPWLRLIALFGLWLVKPSTFTEEHKPE